MLRVKLFDKEYNDLERISVFGFGIIVILLNLFLYEKGNILFDLIAFLFTAIHIAMVYIPFMLKTINAYREVDQPIFKKGFLALSVMAFFFVMILFFQFLDRLTIFLGGEGYSVFYFAGWISGLIGFIAAYFGYIKPKTK